MEYAPYVIENLLDNYVESDSSLLINAILLASCKLFFKSPGEMQEILAKVFDFIFKNFNDVDLKDRAYFFYNLLNKDIEEAEYIICGERAKVDEFSDNINIQIVKIFKEFNSLSVLYGIPEEKFIKKYVNDEDMKKENLDNDLVNNNEDNKKTEINENENIEHTNNIADENNNNLIEQDQYETVNYTKDNFSGIAILNENEYESLWNGYDKNNIKEYSNIPEEIDVDEFSKYLSSENVFVRSYSENNNVLTMLLYSQDVSTYKYYLIYFQIFFINEIIYFRAQILLIFLPI